MQFEGDVDALILMRLEDWPPAAGELVERGFDKTGRERRPRIKEWPSEGARKSDVGI